MPTVRLYPRVRGMGTRNFHFSSKTALPSEKEAVDPPMGRVPGLDMLTAMTLISLEGGSKGFNDRTLFSGAHFELGEGERVGL